MGEVDAHLFEKKTSADLLLCNICMILYDIVNLHGSGQDRYDRTFWREPPWPLATNYRGYVLYHEVYHISIL